MIGRLRKGVSSAIARGRQRLVRGRVIVPDASPRNIRLRTAAPAAAARSSGT